MRGTSLLLTRRQALCKSCGYYLSTLRIRCIGVASMRVPSRLHSLMNMDRHAIS